jgi:hypothetical protein
MSLTTPQPRGAVPAATNQRRILIVAAVIVLTFLVFRACTTHENKYENLARQLTVALQNNDLTAVDKLQNAETATTITRGIVGRLADRLVPLGKIKSVKEVTPTGAAARTHQFDVTFDTGRVHEEMKVDPDDKIVHFNMQPIK